MCRRNQLLGLSAISLGVGLLIGHGLESGILTVGIGVGLILFGLGLLRQK